MGGEDLSRVVAWGAVQEVAIMATWTMVAEWMKDGKVIRRKVWEVKEIAGWLEPGISFSLEESEEVDKIVLRGWPQTESLDNHKE